MHARNTCQVRAETEAGPNAYDDPPAQQAQGPGGQAQGAAGLQSGRGGAGGAGGSRERGQGPGGQAAPSAPGVQESSLVDGHGQLHLPRGPCTLLSPLLSRGVNGAPSHLHLGAEVYVLVGAWREAVAEAQAEDFYYLYDGSGHHRWAMPGEIAWHDVSRA